MLTYPPVEPTLATWTPPRGPEDTLSLDFEYDRQERPTLLGMSVNGSAVSVGWTPQSAYALRKALETGCRVAGHNVIDADIPLVKEHLGIDIANNRVDDTIVYHQLANAWFTNITNKGAGDGTTGDTGGKRGVGLLDLWSFASLYTDLPQWKLCRDGLSWDTFDPPPPSTCSGPCPVHRKRWYNGLDALSVDLAMPVVRADHASKGIPRSTVERVQACVAIARKMRLRGVAVDVAWVDELRKEFKEAREGYFKPTLVPRTCGGCARMSKSPPPCKRCKDAGRPLDERDCGLYYDDGYAAPFNPGSPKQVQEWFRAQGVNLPSTDKEEIYRAWKGTPEGHPAWEWLDRLYSWKDEGKGPDSWFGEEYIHNGRIHPRSIPYGTSSGRWASSGPNYQNMPKSTSGIFARLRGGIIPFPGEQLLRIDYGQMEYRYDLWLAHVWLKGLPMPKLGRELFDDMIARMGHVLERAQAVNNRSKREIFKTIVYAALLGEGAKTYTGAELEKPYVKKAIDAGALVVHKDWHVGDEFMCFTGINLCDRLFGRGNRSFGNRAAVLAIQETFFAEQPILRELHRHLTTFCEQGHGTTPTGRYLHLDGPMGQRFKDVAGHVQQGVVDRVEEALIEIDAGGHTPIMMVHDELDFSLPLSYTKDQMKEIVYVMEKESKIFPGLELPANAQFGSRWLEKPEGKYLQELT